MFYRANESQVPLLSDLGARAWIGAPLSRLKRLEQALPKGSNFHGRSEIKVLDPQGIKKCPQDE